MVGEYDLVGKHPESEHTVRNIDAYESALQELKAAIVPELELIESRIIGPVKEVQNIMKVIRKTMTKREHKVCIPKYWSRFGSRHEHMRRRHTLADLRAVVCV